MKEPIYWTTKAGLKINVDDMDENHVRNAFKMLIKVHKSTVEQANELVDKYNALVKKRKAERGSANFNLNGDMAQFFNEDDWQFNDYLVNDDEAGGNQWN
jgi:hypothetical protein